jgi:hypothetical protein
MKGPYRSSHRRLSAKLVPTFADRRCRVVSTTDPHGRILGFLDRSRYYFFQVAPQLYSQGRVDPVPDSLLLRISGGAGNRTQYLWICSQELWPLTTEGLNEKKIVNLIACILVLHLCNTVQHYYKKIELTALLSSGHTVHAMLSAEMVGNEYTGN